MIKKAKIISLSEKCIKQLSKDAIDAGTNFKNYVEGILEKLAEKTIKNKNTMKTLFAVIAITGLMASCAPGRSGRILTVKIYCDSCEVRIDNYWDKKNTDEKESIWHKVDDSLSVDVERFDSEYSCIRPEAGINYSTDTIKFSYIENGIMLNLVPGEAAGNCY